jgi:sortase (surface protein transpeptidase)
MTKALLAVLLLLIISGSGAALSWYSNTSSERSTALAVDTGEPLAQESAAPTATPVVLPPSTPTATATSAPLEVEQSAEDVTPTPTPQIPTDLPYSSGERPVPTPAEQEVAQAIVPQWSVVEPPRWSPIRLSIPDIKVDARIIDVALTETGHMEAPEDYDEIGWYRLGAKPGDTGRAVMAGHVDSTTGPAVFYRLRDLAPGATIEVTLGGSSETLRYVVQGTATYPEHEAPLERIFGPSDRSELILITCAGDFDFAVGAYPERLVVYAELEPESP